MNLPIDLPHNGACAQRDRESPEVFNALALRTSHDWPPSGPSLWFPRAARYHRPRRPTLRRRLLQVPGRPPSTPTASHCSFPARWPWHGDCLKALNAIRALPAAA